MEVFFIACVALDVISVEELLLRRYANTSYILEMDASAGLAFIRMAFEKEDDERLWQRWLVEYPIMARVGEYMSFEDYKSMLRGENVCDKSAGEIMAEVEAIRSSISVGGD